MKEIEQIVLKPNGGGLGAQNLVEMGQDLQAAGILDVRGLVSELQELGIQAAMATVPVIMEKVRKVQEARIRQMLYEVKLLPPAKLANFMGSTDYVSRVAVLAVIHNVGNTVPRA